MWNPTSAIYALLGASCIRIFFNKKKRLKYESHINLGIFVGYIDIDRFIKIYDSLKRTIKFYRDVVIDETLR
jgi:hypothetical protein